VKAAEGSMMSMKGGFLYGVLSTGIFLFLYLPMFLSLVQAWMRSDVYSHGFLILPISLYLIWTRRGDLRTNPCGPSRAGIPVLMLWAVLYILGKGAEISTFERASIIPFLLGCALVLGGRKIAGIMTFPVLFLIFMIPIPSEIYSSLTNPLAILATTCSVNIMHLVSVPVCQEGNLIILPTCTLEVMDVCSGVRSLISIIALAVLIGYRAFSSTLETLCLLALSVPISLAGNIARITATGFSAQAFPSRFSFPGAHIAAGVSSFLFSLALLLGAAVAIRWVKKKRMQYISWYLR
jgi:exosortase